MAGRSFDLFLTGDAKKESQARTRATFQPVVEQKDSLPRNVGSEVTHLTNTDTGSDIGVLRSNEARTGVEGASRRRPEPEPEKVYKIGESSGDLDDYFDAKKANARMTKADQELMTLKNTGYNAPQPDLKSASDMSPINATEAWAMLKAAHGVLKQHFDSLPVKIASRAAAYKTTADSVAKLAKEHPAMGHLNEGISALGSQDRKADLDRRLNVGNKLVDAQAKLHSIKELDETGHLGKNLRTDLGSDIKHSKLKEAASVLTSVVNSLHNSPLAKFGIGSPIHPDEMQSLANRINTHLITKNVAPKRTSERDVDEVTNAVAKPGHVFVGTRDSEGNLEQLEATPENLAALRRVYGDQSKSVQRMRSFIGRGKTRRVGGLGVETRNVPAGEVPVVEAGRGGHVTVGTENIPGGKTITPAAPRAAQAFPVTEKARANRQAVFDAARQGKLPSEVKSQSENK